MGKRTVIASAIGWAWLWVHSVLFLLPPHSSAENDWIWDRPVRPGSAAFPQSIESSGGIRIVSWNIEAGVLNRHFRRAGPSPLDHNLRLLLDDPPEVLIILEYDENAFEQRTLSKIRRTYDRRYFFPYDGNHEGYGIFVYSSLPLRNLRAIPLDWVPEQLVGTPKGDRYRERWEREDPNSEFFERRTAVLQITPPSGPPLILVPLQFAAPWQRYQKQISHPLLQKAWTAANVFFGQQDPLSAQVLRMMKQVQDTLDENGTSIEASPTLLIGDFNIPLFKFSGQLLNLVGFPAPLRPLQEYAFQSGFEGRTEPTFPAPAVRLCESHLTNEIPTEMQLDHAWGNGRVLFEQANVWPLRGSDHLPIEVVIETR